MSWTQGLVVWEWCFIITMYDFTLRRSAATSWTGSLQMSIPSEILSLIVLAVIIMDMIVPDIFLHSLRQGIQELMKPEEVNSFYPPPPVLPVPPLQRCPLPDFQPSTMSYLSFG